MTKTAIRSPYKGSEKTYEMVKEQIAERWGDGCAEEYDPYIHVLPYGAWKDVGFRVRRGEKALKSITILEKKNEKGEVVKIRKVVNLFHRCQVDPI
jgi:hypothetical protein